MPSHAMPCDAVQLWILKPTKIVLNQWNNNSLKIITSGFDTRIHDLGDVGDLSPQKLRCARRGAIPGEKSNVFSGIRGAVAFRKVPMPNPALKCFLAGCCAICMR